MGYCLGSAQLKWISQFPVEDEHTILPLSNFEIVKARTMSRQALQQEVLLQRYQRIFATLLRLRECPQLKLTFNTLQLLDNIFEEIDNDSNGDLTKGEFQKYVKRSKESVAPTPGDDVAEAQQLKSLLPDKFEDMCNKMDFGDKDGKISRSEFFEYYMDFLLKSSLSVENGTQTVFSLIRQMSPKNAMPSQCDGNRSVFDMSIEQFQRLLQSLNITVTEAETRQLFDFIDDDQDGMLNLAELRF
jgi:Ca2+-binding EF-hand superfamily protein